MKISYNWLKSHVNFDYQPKALAEMLTLQGIESKVLVDNPAWVGVVTAKVLEVVAHPNADKLTLCRLTDGKNEYSVVCGAKNVAQDQVVALALIGAVLPGDFKIEKVKIRSVESQGMICSEKELALKSESEGIMVLDPNQPLGVDINSVIEKDAILEVEIATNRPDCLSHSGIAREIAAKLKKEITKPDVKEFKFSSKKLSVEIKDSAICLRYIGVSIDGICVKQSPKWLSDRVEKCGVRSINNIVDITNYVMFELGHPLHAFDASVVSNENIIVRNALDGESISALDGKKYLLTKEDIIIADSLKPLAIAGVMGGESSGVTNSTKKIILESAVFNSGMVRKTSKRIALSSDASYRFERGVSFEVCELALKRAAKLIVDIAGGVITDSVDCVANKFTPIALTLRQQRIKKLLGVDIATKDSVEILNALGIKAKVDGDVISVVVPSWRNDVSCEADLIEEIARIYGYDKIPTNNALISFSGLPAITTEVSFRNKLLSFGFSEAVNYSFTTQKRLNDIGADAFEFVPNPLSKDNEVLRSTLLEGLLKNFTLNVSEGLSSFKYFEFGKVFLKDKESNHLGIIASGKVFNEWWGFGKNIASLNMDFYYVSGLISELLGNVSNSKITFSDLNLPSNFHPGKAASIYVDNILVGNIGVLRPDLVTQTKDEVIYAQVNVDMLKKFVKNSAVKYAGIKRFPCAKRDISIIVNKNVAFSEINSAIAQKFQGQSDFDSFELFSVYTDEKLGQDKISYSFRISFRSAEKTLMDQEINSQVSSLIDMLSKKFGASLR